MSTQAFPSLSTTVMLVVCPSGVGPCSSASSSASAPPAGSNRASVAGTPDSPALVSTRLPANAQSVGSDQATAYEARSPAVIDPLRSAISSSREVAIEPV